MFGSKLGSPGPNYSPTLSSNSPTLSSNSLTLTCTVFSISSKPLTLIHSLTNSVKNPSLQSPNSNPSLQTPKFKPLISKPPSRIPIRSNPSFDFCKLVIEEALSISNPLKLADLLIIKLSLGHLQSSQRWEAIN